MKKFLAGTIFGYLTFSITLAYQDGVFHRIWELSKNLRPGDTLYSLTFAEMFRYMYEGELPETVPSTIVEVDETLSSEDEEKWLKRIQKMQAMQAEGYSDAEISETLGVSISTMRVSNESTERYFRVTLSENQHQTVEIALRQLSAGDEESEAENESALQAFLDTTEEIE